MTKPEYFKPLALVGGFIEYKYHTGGTGIINARSVMRIEHDPTIPDTRSGAIIFFMNDSSLPVQGKLEDWKAAIMEAVR